MINPLKAMASLMKKFKRRRRFSSELDSRWGDPSISYPNEGSWNQWDQPSGFVANATPGTSQHIQSDGSRRYVPMGAIPSQHMGGSNDPRSRSIGTRDPTRTGSTIPKGYFDENIRHRSERSYSPHVQGLGIDGTRHVLSDVNSATADDESCDEGDEEGDTLGDSRGGMMHRGYTATDMSRSSRCDDRDSYTDHSARSPPLSVTSRMRRITMQSSTTEQSSSIAGTASSRHTSYTAASSVSAPSLPPDTPRYAFNAMHPAPSEKRPVPRPRYREPELPVRPEMVPSYDELYG